AREGASAPCRPAVELRGRFEPVFLYVNGVRKEKPSLSNQQYRVVSALLSAEGWRLTGSALDDKAALSGAHKILKRLAEDRDWAAVLVIPGGAWKGGYGICSR